MRKHNKALPGRHCRWRVAQTKTNIDKPTTTTRREQGEGKQEAVGDGGQPARQGETNPTDMAWVVHDVVGVAAAGYRGVRPGQKAGEKEAGGREPGRLRLDWVAGYSSVTTHALVKSQITTHGVANSGSRPPGQYQTPRPPSTPWPEATPIGIWPIRQPSKQPEKLSSEPARFIAIRSGCMSMAQSLFCRLLLPLPLPLPPPLLLCISVSASSNSSSSRMRMHSGSTFDW